ncbi:MAG: TPM domain-containing protein, partial [Candidatus Acidiferrales bacterium]
MRRCFRSLAFALACFTLLALAVHAEDPKQIKPTGYVIDLAGVLSPASRDQLTALCTELDQKAHAQIAVVTVHSLNGLPIEEFSIDVATQLGVGPKSDRGVLILFATDDRRYRVEVGY